MDDKKQLCPMLTSREGTAFQWCVKEECAWWNEDKQKCVIAVLGAKK